MVSSPPFSHSTLAIFALFLILPSSAIAVNVTTLLSAYPDLSEFVHLLTSTSVAEELTGRSSLTLLVVPNTYLLRSDLVGAASASPAADIADVLRYHVLLEYLSPADLLRLPTAGKLITTLYQTTGRAAADLGAVNVTALSVRSPVPFSNATVLGPVTAVPYNISVFAVDGFLVPYGFDLAASESRSPAAVNVTRALVEAHGFNVAASMLEASGVAEEFESDEGGAGITVFVPTDEAFAGLPATWRLQSLAADKKAAVLRFHALHSYYPLGSLESIVNPVQPTLATEVTGAGRFTLNITRVNGTVTIDTGIVQATITRTVFDQNPVAVFAVSRVLLPREIFDLEEMAAPPLDMAPPPETTEETPPTRLSSPPGRREEAGSGAARRKATVGCIVLVSLLLLVREI